MVWQTEEDHNNSDIESTVEISLDTPTNVFTDHKESWEEELLTEGVSTEAADDEAVTGHRTLTTDISNYSP